MIEPHVSEARQSAGRWRSLTLGSLLAAGLLAGLFTSSTASATALVLPPAGSLVNCVRNAPDTNLIDPSSCLIAGAAKASVAQAPFVELQAEASNSVGNTAGNSGLAKLGYSFEVIGGTPGALVPLLISANLFTAAVSRNTAVAGITIGTLGLQFTAPQFHAVETACSGDPALCLQQPPPDSSFDGTFGVTAVDGVLGVVQLVVQAGVGATGGTAIATADPFIFIDPTFALDNPNDTIVLSDGVVNGLPTASTVPEPSSIVLLMVGLTGLAGLRRGMGQGSRLASLASAGAVRI